MTTRKTLSLGGTLSVNTTPKDDTGVSIEVRKRRFEKPAEDKAALDAEAQRRLEALEKAKEESEAARKAELAAAAALGEARKESVKKKQEADAEREAAVEAAKAETAAKAEAATQNRREAHARVKGEELGVTAEEMPFFIKRQTMAEADAAEEARLNAEREKAAKAAAAEAAAAAAKAGSGEPSHLQMKRNTSNVAEQFRRNKDAQPSGRATGKETGKKRGRNAYLSSLEERTRTVGNRNKTARQARDAARSENYTAEKVFREVEIPEFITVQELAGKMSEKGSDVVKKLMGMGEMVTLTQTIDQDTAALIVEEMGHTPVAVQAESVEAAIAIAEDAADDLHGRPPVVTVMGHVDHGKTTLLDSLRNARIAAGEAGGITQHIGAYQVELDGKKITFLDTPGHAAFTAMRARGANMTDVVILVVAADDGVMPQTKEAIQHAKAAGVPIVVAINKMDKPDATPDRVKNELLSEELVLEDFGGDVPSVPVSALKGNGLKELMEHVLLQAEMLDLKANPNRRSEGAVVEAKLDKGRGPVATVVVASGTLKTGDIVVAGTQWGRVRGLVNDRGESIKEAGPSTPVEILGLAGVPAAGDAFVVAENERVAKEVADHRAEQARDRALAARTKTLDNLFATMEAGDKSELNVIIKADVQGSAEAIKASLEQLDTPQVSVKVIQSAVGVVTETDVNLALSAQDTGGALIVAFNVRADATARKLAERDGVEIKYYNIIYELIDDVKQAMAGLLAPEFKEEALGTLDVRAIFTYKKTKVGGGMVTDGELQRGAKARLVRDGKVMYDGTIATLQREKDQAKTVASGYECGFTLDKFDDLKEGDQLECYKLVELEKNFDDLLKAEKEGK